MEDPRRRRQRTSNTMNTEFPADIILSDILPRLPAKSLSRFKCVSKQWQSFLSSPAFSKINLHHITTDNHHDHHKILLFSSAPNPRVFQTLDQSYGLTASRSFPFKLCSEKTVTFITSLNGLVCVGITCNWLSSSIFSDMILWNPCTNDCKSLSKPINNFHKECYKVTVNASGLYYIDSDDDYRLLRVTEGPDFYLYSLKSDSWRKLKYSFDQIPRPYSNTWGVSYLQNEKLYFLTSDSVTTFDTKTEKLAAIATPSFGDVPCLNSVFLQKDGKIHVCVIYSGEDSRDLSAKLWRMDGDGEWTKVATYLIPRNLNFYEPHHLMRNGNWITFCRSKCHVHEFDPSKDFKKVYRRRIDNPPKGKYIETLVSPLMYR